MFTPELSEERTPKFALDILPQLRRLLHTQESMPKHPHKQAQPAPKKSTGPVENLQGAVDSKVLQVVQDFLKAHDALQSKYWPMLETFVRTLEKGVPVKKVASNFHWAFRQARPEEQGIPAYWYRIVNDTQRVALMGRAWVKEHRAKGFGFWKLLELAIASEPLKKRRPQPKPDRIDNEHFEYFVHECPDLFPVLCAAFLEEGKLPDIAHEQKQKHVYERLCVRMLTILLNDATYFFSPKHNWPTICERILGQIEPSQFPRIIDVETN
jgi:hypothetical protein